MQLPLIQQDLTGKSPKKKINNAAKCYLLERGGPEVMKWVLEDLSQKAAQRSGQSASLRWH